MKIKVRLKELFHHDLLKGEKLERKKINGVRHYLSPTGIWLKSVTSVLGDYYDDGSLQKWRDRVGQKEADHISNQAASRGTKLHNTLENIVLNQEVDLSKLMPPTRIHINQIRKQFEKHITSVRGVEIPLWSDSLKTAGTADLLAEWDGYLAVLDYKTSAKPKKEEWIEKYFVQSSTYAKMVQERFNLDVKYIIIIIE